MSFLGDSTSATLSADYSLPNKSQFFQSFNTSAGLNISLPSIGNRYFIHNSGSNTFTLKDETGSALTTVAADVGIWCFRHDNGWTIKSISSITQSARGKRYFRNTTLDAHAANLQHAYLFDGDLVDTIGGADLSIVSGTPILTRPGKNGKGLLVPDGDCRLLTNSINLPAPGYYTIAFWANILSNEYLFRLYSSGTNYVEVYPIPEISTGKFCYYVSYKNGASTLVSSVFSRIPEGYALVALTHDGTDGKLYIDGVLIETFSSAPFGIYTSLQIGQLAGNTNDKLFMDELYIWDDVLPIASIAELADENFFYAGMNE